MPKRQDKTITYKKMRQVSEEKKKKICIAIKVQVNWIVKLAGNNAYGNFIKS